MLPRELENRLKLFRASRKRQQGSRSDCLRHIRVTHIVRTFNALCVGVPVSVCLCACACVCVSGCWGRCSGNGNGGWNIFEIYHLRLHN